jgi:ABC-2 type transport system permease protein
MTTIDVRVAQRVGTIALAGREVRRVLSLWTQTILPPVLTAALFLAVFGGALGGRIGSIEGIPYPEFILAGLLVMTAATQAFANNSTSLFQAKSEGYIDDVLTSPLRPWQLALAYMAGGLVRAFAAVLAIAVVTAPFVGSPEQPEFAVASLALTALVFSALGVITGIWAENFDQHAFVASVVIAPLALLGAVFYAARTLPEPWQTLTRLDPLYYVVDSTRAGFTGFHESPVWLSLVVTGVVAAVAFVAATHLLARGWRLKP